MSIQDLSEEGKRILLKIGELEDKAKVEEIQDETNLDQSTIMRMALQLEEDNLAIITEKSIEKISLTHEGKTYVERGLPEKKLLRILSEEGPLTIKEMNKKTSLSKDKTQIGIGWLKRKDWIRIESKGEIRIIKITGNGEKALEEKGKDEILLDKIRESEEVLKDEIPEELHKFIPDLSRRNLISIKERKQYIISLTDKGKRTLDSGLNIEETVSQLTRELITSGKWKEKKLRKYDVTAPVNPIYPGKIHPQQRVIEELRSILLKMGFKEIKGSSVESEFWNFDVLFQAQNHPAREIHDTLSLSKPNLAKIRDKGLLKRVRKAHEEGVSGSTGWGYEFDEELSHRTIMCSQTTSKTVRYLASQPEPPVKVFSIDRVFRRERIDYKHLAEFTQAEGIVMAPDLDFRDMLGYLRQILVEMGISKVRFRPGYFPFTEPSAEADGYLSEKDEWIELLGAGMFRPELLKPLGIDYPVLAWGIGFSRIAMIRLGVKDMRDLHKNDLEWLKKQSLV